MGSLLDLMVDPAAYHRITFEFGAVSTPLGVALPIAAGLITFALWFRSLPQGRLWLALLRSSVVLLITLLVLNPTLVGQKSVPGSQFVLMLFDDSKSMTILETDGSTRSEKLQNALDAENHGLERQLARTHQLTYYRFGSDVHRIRSAESLRFEEGRSSIVSAIEGALGRAVGTQVAAVILFSDGIQQTPDPVRVSALPTDTPVFTVGTGTRQDWPSLALTDLAVSRSPFDQSPVHVTFGVSAIGLAGERVILEVLDGNRRITSDAFEILSDSVIQKRRLEFVPERPGWLRYRSRVRLADQPFEGITPIANDRDPLTDDNVRDFVVDNRDRTFRILYFSGRPNWEHKFARRALAEDPQLNLSSLI